MADAHDPNVHADKGNGWRSRSRLALIAFLVIAGFFLITEHTAHVLGVLPYVLLLACPLVHFFHGGHGRRNDADGHGGHSMSRRNEPPR